MRKILDFVSIGLLAVLFSLTFSALYGNGHLADKFPTHLDAVGRPDRWGTPSSLEILPFLALLMYLFISVVAVISSLRKRSDDEEPEDPSPLENLTLGLIAWIKAEVVGLFTCLQITLLEAMWHPERGSTLLAVWLLLGAIVATIAWYVSAMVHTVRVRVHQAP